MCIDWCKNQVKKANATRPNIVVLALKLELRASFRDVEEDDRLFYSSF